jgi:hypothetical protein
MIDKKLDAVAICLCLLGTIVMMITFFVHMNNLSTGFLAGFIMGLLSLLMTISLLAFMYNKCTNSSVNLAENDVGLQLVE